MQRAGAVCEASGLFCVMNGSRRASERFDQAGRWVSECACVERANWTPTVEQGAWRRAGARDAPRSLGPGSPQCSVCARPAWRASRRRRATSTTAEETGLGSTTPWSRCRQKLSPPPGRNNTLSTRVPSLVLGPRSINPSSVRPGLDQALFF